MESRELSHEVDSSQAGATICSHKCFIQSPCHTDRAQSVAGSVRPAFCVASGAAGHALLALALLLHDPFMELILGGWSSVQISDL